jgi:cystine transport system substrate-binding protein
MVAPKSAEPTAVKTAAPAAAPAAAAPAPTVVITTPTPVSRPISATVSAADWDRIRAAGRLIVGMSSGYRPFAYTNESSELDGFDVAVAREIAQRLGVTAEAKDMPPGALMDALRARQIDLALPGPGSLPVGDAAADFTKPYYVCRDFILAAKGSAAVEMRAPADLIAQRVGVLAGSRHETWLQRTLLDTGQMESSGLFTFTLVSQMMNALQGGQIDLAILDRVQAQPLLEQDGVRLVGQDLNKQNHRLAVPKGFDRLRGEVDSALAEMARDGTLTRLTGQYLGLTEADLAPVPTPTSEIRVTPPPSPSPTAEPPVGSFTANPIHIAPGECTLFTWNVEDVREVYFYARGEDWEDWPTTGQESRQVCPVATVTYELRVVNSDGRTERRSITILVDEHAPLPLSSRLTTDPASEVEIGSCVKLSWEVRGSPTMVHVVRDHIVLWNNAPEAGSMEDCPPEPGTVVYGVLASTPGHTTQTQRVITVNP